MLQYSKNGGMKMINYKVMYHRMLAENERLKKEREQFSQLFTSTILPNEKDHKYRLEVHIDYKNLKKWLYYNNVDGEFITDLELMKN